MFLLLAAAGGCPSHPEPFPSPERGRVGRGSAPVMKPGDLVHLDRPGCPYHEASATVIEVRGSLERPWTDVVVEVAGPIGPIPKTVRRFQCRPIFEPGRHKPAWHEVERPAFGEHADDDEHPVLADELP